MAIDSFTALFIIMAFVIPGYILNSVYRRITPQAKEDTQLSFLRFILSSLINYVLWSWLIYWIYETGYYKTHQLTVGIIWVSMILLSPILIGITWGFINQRKWIENTLNRLGITSINSIPTSWDYKFYTANSPRWILVTMKDNSKVAGLWGNSSFASSQNEDRDLYIEKVYILHGKKPWTSSPKNNDGIYIACDQIKTIEFFNN
jgi:hypothetical protein